MESLSKAHAAESPPGELMDALRRAWDFARNRSWCGVDPYDGLLSPLSRVMSGRMGRPFRLALSQAVKRAPIDVRRFLRIRPGINAKALSLALSAAARCPSASSMAGEIRALITALIARRSPGVAGFGWGYNFPWQGRSFYLPAGTPTVVVTSFAGIALLDAFDATRDRTLLDSALQACRFVRESLNRRTDATGQCLSYSPLDRTVVYNASMLGARLLAQTGAAAGRAEVVEAARPLVGFVLARQRSNGSWPYGEDRNQDWVDSFHTGFVLEALEVYRRATNDAAVESALRKGMRFYAENFFGPNGEPYYAPHRRYPYDIHSAAQGVLTFLQLRHLGKDFPRQAAQVGRWMIARMLDPEGFFYYQVRRTHVVRIPYMRWSQAWGVRALAEMAREGIEP